MKEREREKETGNPEIIVQGRGRKDVEEIILDSTLVLLKRKV